MVNMFPQSEVDNMSEEIDFVHELFPCASSRHTNALVKLVPMKDIEARGHCRRIVIAYCSNNALKLSKNSQRICNGLGYVSLILLCGNNIQFLCDAVQFLVSDNSCDVDLLIVEYQRAYSYLSEFDFSLVSDEHRSVLQGITEEIVKAHEDLFIMVSKPDGCVSNELRHLCQQLCKEDSYTKRSLKNCIDEDLRLLYEVIGPTVFYSVSKNHLHRLLDECSDLSQGKVFDDSFAPSCTILATISKFSFSMHVIFALMLGRKLVIIGSSKNEIQIRKVVECYSHFIPTCTKSVLPFTRNLNKDMLLRYQIIGVEKAPKLPEFVRKEAIVVDYDYETYTGPIYDRGMIINVLLEDGKLCPNDSSFILYLNSTFEELRMKSRLFKLINEPISEDNVPVLYNAALFDVFSHGGARRERNNTLTTLGLSLKKRLKEMSQRASSEKVDTTSVRRRSSESHSRHLVDLFASANLGDNCSSYNRTREYDQGKLSSVMVTESEPTTPASGSVASSPIIRKERDSISLTNFTLDSSSSRPMTKSLSEHMMYRGSDGGSLFSSSALCLDNSQVSGILSNSDKAFLVASLRRRKSKKMLRLSSIFQKKTKAEKIPESVRTGAHDVSRSLVKLELEDYRSKIWSILGIDSKADQLIITHISETL